MRVAFDTNILAYMAGVDKAPEDSAKIAASISIHGQLAVNHDCVAPLQALGELYVVLSRFRSDRTYARSIVEAFQDQFEVAPSSADCLSDSLILATDHKIQFWDALIINSAADAGCALLLSEDMQAGFTWRGVRLANPFAAKLDSKLAKLISV
jgi:predicted nucleic acid-binding protein